MKKRITAGTMVIVVLALLLSAVAGGFGIYLRQLDAARQSLHELLSLAQTRYDPADPLGMAEDFHAAAPDKRLTLIAPDGTVLADTGGEVTENHADRPEFKEAAATGWGEITRASATLGCPMLYVAKRFPDGAVGRAAMPLSSVDALVWAGMPPVLLGALAALVLAFALSRSMAGRLVEPLRAVENALREALEGRESAGLEEYRADEELRPILRTLRELTGRLGESLRQVKAERDKAELILDSMDEGLLLLDEEENILAVNRAARELLRLGPEGERGASVLLRGHRLRQGLDTARREGTTVVLDLHDPALGEGELRFFLTPVTGREYGDRPVGAAVLITDVTELKKAERARSEFTANVSHELKTPLTSIKGFSEMLAGGMVKDPTDQQRFLTLIGVEVDRLISLINDVLEISELESVRIREPDETASPLETARETADLLSDQARSKNIAVYVSGDEGLARIAPHRLKELLLNLMENAVKYGKEGGGVEVKTLREGDHMTVTVRDDGIGIPPGALEHVFERFYRVDKGRSRQSGGTGLGLAIVKHIAELCGGTVTVESTLGRGSTFTVTLPAAE